MCAKASSWADAGRRSRRLYALGGLRRAFQGSFLVSFSCLLLLLLLLFSSFLLLLLLLLSVCRHAESAKLLASV